MDKAPVCALFFGPNDYVVVKGTVDEVSAAIIDALRLRELAFLKDKNGRVIFINPLLVRYLMEGY